MADPNLEDLAELAALGGGAVDNPYAELLAAGAPLFLAKVSDSMRDLIGNLGRANRRVIQLEQRQEVTGKNLAAAMQTINELDELHEEQERYGTYGEVLPASKIRCAGCGKKWPCKSRRILEVLLDGPIG